MRPLVWASLDGLRRERLATFTHGAGWSVERVGGLAAEGNRAVYAMRLIQRTRHGRPARSPVQLVTATLPH